MDKNKLPPEDNEVLDDDTIADDAENEVMEYAGLFKGFNSKKLKKVGGNLAKESEVLESLSAEEQETLKNLQKPTKLTAEEKARLRELQAKEAKIRRDNATTRTFFKMIDVLSDGAQNANPFVSRKKLKSVTVDTDISYADEDVCKLDIYRVPKEETDTEKYPVMLEIHGGGFVAGDKKYRRALSQFFALEGMTVFTINYGLSPDYHYPDPAKHIFRALDFIADHAEEYNLDTSRIIVSGDSAGAYYAALVAAGCNNKEYLDKLDVHPKACPTAAILNCGIYDIDIAFNANVIFDIGNKLFSCFMGKGKAEFDDYEYKDFCAANQLIKDYFPPSFIVYSPNDVFCKGQSESLINILSANGSYFESFCADQKASNHCFPLVWRGYDAIRANALMLSFIQRYLRGTIKY